MSLEAQLEANTKAVNRLAEIMEKGGAVTGSAKATGGASTAKPKHTDKEVTSAVVKVKKKHGDDAAKELIKTVGKADKLAEVKPENYDALYDAAVAKEAEDAEDAGGGL